jgi:hypothetical protein
MSALARSKNFNGLVRAENQLQTRASKILEAAKDTPLD